MDAVSGCGGVRGRVRGHGVVSRSECGGISLYSSLLFSGMYRQYKYERATVDADITAVVP